MSAVFCCLHPGCDRQADSRGLCGMHYQLARRLGTLPPLTPPPTPRERFLAKVSRQPNGCWLWIGAINTNGYGAFRGNGRTVPAHRWSYEQHVGAIPAGLHLDHLCRTPLCVNPDHLEPVTPAENVRRGIAPSASAVRTGMCVQGLHPLPKQANNGAGKRVCVECRKARSRAKNHYRGPRKRAA